MTVLRKIRKKEHWQCQQILRRKARACMVCQFNIIVRKKKLRKKKATALTVFNQKLLNPQLVFVPAVGLEPTRPLGQQILSLPRLPFRHAGKIGLIEIAPADKNCLQGDQKIRSNGLSHEMSAP